MVEEQINTRINSDGVYEPDAVPHIETIKTLYYIDYWDKWLSKDAGSSSSPITQRKLGAYTRRIGYDNHPTAYGNAYIGLFNGLSGTSGYSPNGEFTTQIASNLKLLSRNDSEFTHNVDGPIDADKYLNQVFCGALAPELSFDTVTSRFAISGLHTSEKITAKHNATFSIESSVSATTPEVVPVPDNIGKDCYRINKVFDFRSYCPSISPYYITLGASIVGTFQNDFPLVYNNPYCQVGKVFDMSSGIFMEDFNITEQNWKNSFWGICGFNYDDLNIENTGNINARITDGNYNNIAKLTTNQNVVNSNIGEWDGAATGVANYHNQYTYPTLIRKTGGVLVVKTFAPVEIESQSAKIEATSLPTKTLRPYFTIRSDLISDSYFTGGNDDPSLMPVIAVLKKNEQYGDFFYGSSDIEFTNTFPRSITQVSTQICDPSGKPAKLSPNSAVMYKIVKQNNTNLNIIQDVMNANKNNPQLLATLQ